jgi:hypothetical protein
MSNVVKTSEEFSSRRKIRYGGTDSSMPSIFKDKPLYSLTPTSINASITPHKSFYGKDSVVIMHILLNLILANFVLMKFQFERKVVVKL